MRRFIPAAAVAVTLLCASGASAQFANKSLGIAPGFMVMNADPDADWAVPLSLEGTLYIENGFDLVIRAAPMLLTGKLEKRQYFAVSFNLGIRYLLSEESLRPYIGASLAGLYIERADHNKGYGGIGAFGGVDYFLSDSISIGARAFVNLYLMLNTQSTTGLGFQGVVATYF
ncbi:MAG: hypothetical protein ACYC8T_03740 [Myxococcaceae bacterium]